MQEGDWEVLQVVCLPWPGDWVVLLCRNCKLNARCLAWLLVSPPGCLLKQASNGAGILLPAGASTVPVEKDHTEEMVTRCIVEVLSNALSKPNAPPINPECKEILKKSDKNDRERSENEQPEVRHPKDPAETEKHPPGSMEKEQRQAEEESEKYMEGGDEEKLAHEEGKSEEEEAGHHTPAQDETLHVEEKKHYQEIGREEERNYHSEEESKEGKCCEDVEAAVVTKKSHSEGMSVDEFRGGSDQSPRGHWHLEEGMQSPSKQIGEGEEGEEGRSEKYHHESQERGFSHQQQREASEESEEREEGKEPFKGKGYHGKHRGGDSSEEKRGHGGERGEPAGGSQPGEANLWEQWKHRQKHEEESEEKGGSPGRRGPEGLQQEGPAEPGSEELSWQQSQESRDEENKRHHHSEESSEKWHEERRQHSGSHHPGGRMHLAEGSQEELARYLSQERQRRVGGRARGGNRQQEGAQKAREHKGQASRHYSTEDSLEEEEVEKKHHSSDQVENEEEERFAEREEYRGHLPAEKEKRTAASYRPFYPLVWWKSQHLDKRDSAGEQLLEGREEGRPALSEKSLFPEYNDYEWWSEKQIQSALKHRRSEKRNPGKANRYDVERQYNKMDQLAQLLNYRKKSAELPGLYSSGEDLKKRRVAGNDRRSLSQRPLTEEEEKQLENLATMDLELQNIAEKINSLRRG
ncbi:secretogranin-1 isoform X1 [Melospiza melodia melodia]|uniref:secretogranin-1 isoform X1 n=1 Tax=Melospiza melodia melodia TaxID=1914991 RepID=UPI002FCFCC09